MAKSHVRNLFHDIHNSKHELTKRIYNKMNYEIRLPLKLWINVLTLSKNHVRYLAEDKGAHNGLKDKGAHNWVEV